MSHHDWWVISLVIVLILMVFGAVIGGVLLARFIIDNGWCGHPQCQPKSREVTTTIFPGLPPTTGEYILVKMDGYYSDRLRKQFPPNDPAWNPPDDREDSPSKGQPIPKGVEGRNLGGRGKK